MEYVERAWFVYDPDCKSLCARLEENPFDTRVDSLEIEELRNRLEAGGEVGRVVVAGSLELVKQVFRLAEKYAFQIGIIPLPEQKNLINCFDLPTGMAEALDLALQGDAVQSVDTVYCNGELVLFKATLGRIPILDSIGYSSRWELFLKSVRQLMGIKLLPFKITTAAGRVVDTCACGCMVLQHGRKSWVAGMIGYDSSGTDGNVSLLVSAPFSIYDYFTFIIGTLRTSRRKERIPETLGYIESPEITIDSDVELDVHIDGERATKTPLHCRVREGAVKVNVGPEAREAAREAANGEGEREERIEIGNLPRGKEVVKLQRKKLPLFSIASEDRFKDPFIALRGDARIDNSYIVLMLLSTALATIGVYLDSPAVVIGAMLLAPLMSPIVSLAMGLLRRNNELTINSLEKIALGIFLALSASSILVLFFSYKPITSEMMGRLNPSLLDLGVAIIAGIAAAYSKSFKEVMQGLAGVAIAVALVPPLAVAGIGLGRGDFYFFGHAFLLFLTNLVGIVFAAIFTFRVLGFSPAVKGRRSVLLIVLMLVMITVPLYYSYTRIVKEYHAEKSWRVERFLVNGKYIIIRNIRFGQQRNRKILFMDIMARQSLPREDLNLLKQKIKRNFPGDLVIRAKIEYIL